MNGGDVVGNIYLTSFYFCLTTMISVGYGDISTYNNFERIYVVIIQFASAIVFASIIASITAVVASMDMNARKTAEELDAVASFCSAKHFPEALGRRIRRHFRNFYSLKTALKQPQQGRIGLSGFEEP